MAYVPLTKIPQQFFDNLGNPLVGGTLYAYLAGTSTATNMFSDNAGTVAGTSVVLDSRGEPTTFKLIWIDSTKNYKFVLKDSTGTTIWTIDNISGDDTADASMVTFIQTGSSAVATTVQSKARESVSPEDFGAIGNNVADDRAAIIAALTSHSTVILTEGKTYKSNGSITIPANKTITGTGKINFSSGKLILSNNSIVDGIIVEGNANTNNEDGVSGSNTSGWIIRNCKIQNIQFNGIQCAGASYFTVENNVIYNTGTPAGAILPSNSYLGHGVHVPSAQRGTIRNNDISASFGQAGIFIDSSNSITVSGNYIHDTFWAGIRGYDTAAPCTKVVIDSNRLEAIGLLNDTGSVVGCNGIANFSAYTTPAEYDIFDWVVTNNYLQFIEENGIEGAGFVCGNTIYKTNNGGLAAISPEGIYTQGPAKILDNTIYLSGPGIRVYRDGTEAAGDKGYVEIVGNTTIDPANGWGIQVNAINAGGSITALQVKNNTTWNGGIQVSTASGASYDATSFVTNNVSYGGLGNASSIAQSLANVSGNNFDPVYTSIASGTTIAITQGAKFVEVTGTTNISTISAATSIAGRQVTLKFTGILTVNDGSNLKLAGNFTTSADDTLTLICDGTDWYEIARSVN